MFTRINMVVYFRVFLVGMFFYSCNEAATSFANVGRLASGASKFVDDRVLQFFRGQIFSCSSLQFFTVTDSFDVCSLFTNITLRKKTVNIILDRTYKDNQIQTSLDKRTLKILLLDSCTKTLVSINRQSLISSDMLKFYVRYVDDTLVLARPSDILTKRQKLNSFHPQIKFTHEQFTDIDIHFVDNKITSTGTTSYRKSTHTGLYVHLSSFTLCCRKTAWLRAFVYRVHKICSNSVLLHNELQRITKFVSWNGFPRRLVSKLINKFTPTTNDNSSENNNNTDPRRIWIHLPFIGKRGTILIRSCTTKISRLLKDRVKFITLWDTTNTNAFLTLKIGLPKNYTAKLSTNLLGPDVNLPTLAKLTAASSREYGGP